MKILSVIGARPQFVKAAVFRKYCLENEVEEVLLHTGQHYDPEMSTAIFSDLDVQMPDVQYDLKSRTHAGMIAEIIQLVEAQILKIQPDLINVYGDTNTTLAAALAAAKLNIKIMHIEAGIRSFNKSMPEEINRVLTDHVSTFLFCPTQTAVRNLMNENITNGVVHVGDIMYDAVKNFSHKFKMPKFTKLDKAKKIAVMTVHREATVYNKLALLEVIKFCKIFLDDYNIIFPMHPNTRRLINDYALDVSGFICTSPLPYLEMQGLLSEAHLVLTDSGGLQKEAYFHNCDCITLRDETEWVETIDKGWNRLWNCKKSNVIKAPIEDFGSGNVCSNIFNVLANYV